MKSLSTDHTVANIITGSPSYTAGSYTLTGLVVGRSYLWTKGANDATCVVNGSITLAATGVFTATATSVTLTGTGTSAITAQVSLMITAHIFQTTFTPTFPTKQVTIGEFPSGNPNVSRLHQISNEAHYVKRGTVGVAMLVSDFSTLALQLETGLTWTPPIILTQPVSVACAATAAATGTLTWDNSAGPSDGDTVTIGTTVYTFKTTLTPTAGQVLLNGGGDAALLNLIRAINHTGTAGTDYANLGSTAVANTQVTAAASVTSHAFAVTALTSGTAGNAIATTETSAHLSWGSTTLAGGTVAAATITVAPGSEYDLTYQWQYSADGSTGWTNATGTVNGCAYTNGTTATLTCTPTTTGQTGYYHRCTVTDNATSPGSITTDGLAILTIP